jgi:hypothetical protein
MKPTVLVAEDQGDEEFFKAVAGFKKRGGQTNMATTRRVTAWEQLFYDLIEWAFNPSNVPLYIDTMAFFGPKGQWGHLSSP